MHLRTATSVCYSMPLANIMNINVVDLVKFCSRLYCRAVFLHIFYRTTQQDYGKLKSFVKHDEMKQSLAFICSRQETHLGAVYK